MDEEKKRRSKGQLPVPPPTRRACLAETGRKVAYVTPVIMTLAASRALAAGSNPSADPSVCQEAGEPCSGDSDCCSGVCSFITMTCQ